MVSNRMQVMEDVDGSARAANAKGFYPIAAGRQPVNVSNFRALGQPAGFLGAQAGSSGPYPAPRPASFASFQAILQRPGLQGLQPGRPASFSALMQQVGFRVSAYHQSSGQ